MDARCHSVFGGFLFLVGAGLLTHSFDPHYAGMGAGAEMGPMTYPRILLWVWVALSAILVAQPLIGRERAIPPQRWGHLAGIVAAVGACTVLMTTIGFLFATILFCVAGSLLMGHRRPLGLALTGIVFPIGTWYLFQQVLMIRLPVSPWFPEI